MYLRACRQYLMLVSNVGNVHTRAASQGMLQARFAEILVVQCCCLVEALVAAKHNDIVQHFLESPCLTALQSLSQGSAWRESCPFQQSFQSFRQKHQQAPTAAAGFLASPCLLCLKLPMMPPPCWRQLCHQTWQLTPWPSMVLCTSCMLKAASLKVE